MDFQTGIMDYFRERMSISPGWLPRPSVKRLAPPGLPKTCRAKHRVPDGQDIRVCKKTPWHRSCVVFHVSSDVWGADGQTEALPTLRPSQTVSHVAMCRIGKAFRAWFDCMDFSELFTLHGTGIFVYAYIDP